MDAAHEIENPERDLATQFIQLTDKSLFLTGRAGTGKTTFLRWVVDNVKKRMAVVAPTGVAAINARGMTIHSFFQIPTGPHAPVRYAPNALYDPRWSGAEQRANLRKDRRALIRSLDLLIIDEISMVRADLLDAIDGVLREYRNATRPFGGVQLLVIGDLYQLAPVTRPEEWGLVAPFYDSPYFFSSYAYRLLQPITIELQHIYRQRDASFIDILNEVREGQVSQPTLDTLNRLYDPDITKKLPKNTILLSSHNKSADELNAGQLERIKSKTYTYKAVVQGTFPQSMYPVAEEIELKEGAQVMFCKNDTTSMEPRYFNGKIGRVTELDDKSVTVLCEGDDESITVEKTLWENMETTLDPAGEVTRGTIGTFTQIPLRLAWAITIHKSQGLTFDRVIIDAARAFSAGQVYVALSRCRTLSGICLSSKLPAYAIKTDGVITSTMHEVRSRPVDESTLQNAILEFNRNSLVSLYDFEPELQMVDRLARLAQQRSIDRPLFRLCAEVASKLTELHRVGEKFVRQIDKLLDENSDLEKNEQLQERIKAAAHYFIRELDTAEIKSFLLSAPSSEDELITQRYETAMTSLLNVFYPHEKLLEYTQTGYNATTFHQKRIELMIANVNWEEWRSQQREKTEEEADEETKALQELIRRIETWRTAQAKKEGKRASQILTKENITDLAQVRPRTIDELAMVKGFGEKRVSAYGAELVALVRGEGN